MPKLKVPSRVVLLDDQPVVLRADYNAMMTVEDLTGRPIFAFVEQKDDPRVFTAVAQLAYALSATHREDEGQVLPTDPQDLQRDFRAWCRHLPPVQMDEFNRFANTVMSLVLEALTGKVPDLPGNAPTPDPPEPAEEPQAA